jgi:hypothetical protein
MNEEINQDNIRESKVHTLKQCIHCKTNIPAKAGTCRYCHLSQGRFHWLRHVPYIIPVVLVIAALAQLSIAYYQMDKASKERIEARMIKEDVEKIRDNLREVMKYVSENEFILLSSSFMAAEGKTKHRDHLLSNLDKMLDFVEPDVEKKDKWWKPIDGLFEFRRQKEE